MPAHDALTVSLTPELRHLAHAQAASGRRRTASEAGRAGLHFLTCADAERAT